jgi:tripartite-type tricarboxylate transporter receptor subunit TctC
VLATAYSKRLDLFPDAPTLAELGIRGVEGVIWYRVSGPSGIPAAAVTRLNGKLRRLLATPDVQERFAQQGAIATPTTPQEYTAFIKAELAKWAAVVRSSGAKVD